MRSERSFTPVPFEDTLWLHARRWLYGRLGLRRAATKNRGAQILRGYFEGAMDTEVPDDYRVRPGDRFVLTRLPFYDSDRTRDDVLVFDKSCVSEEDRFAAFQRSMHREWVASARRASREEQEHRYQKELRSQAPMGVPRVLLGKPRSSVFDENINESH